MTRLVFVLAMLLSSVCNGQWWKWARSPRLDDMKFRLDTLRYNGDMVLIQRYEPGDLLSFENNADPDLIVAYYVFRLQQQFDSYRDVLKYNKTIGISSDDRNMFGRIAEKQTGFDTSYLEAEYRFYYKYSKPLPDEEYAAKLKAVNFELDILMREDSNVITPFDSVLASKYEPYRGSTKSQYEAYRKVSRIAQARDKRYNDSLYAVMEADYLAHIEKKPVPVVRHRPVQQRDLVKKYGAEDAGLISQGRVAIGWDKEMCERSWGKPLRTQKNTTLRRVEETWSYSRSRKLVFIHDVLVRIVE